MFGYVDSSFDGLAPVPNLSNNEQISRLSHHEKGPFAFYFYQRPGGQKVRLLVVINPIPLLTMLAGIVSRPTQSSARWFQEHVGLHERPEIHSRS